MPKSRQNELQQLLASVDQYISELEGQLLERLRTEEAHDIMERLAHLKVARHNLVAAIGAESPK
jgi:hypothetical protein